MADHIPNPLPTDEAVRLYLAERDAPCPGCGYNLRGIEHAACPECGRGIELTLSRPGRSRGYLLFVLLALGWVLTAGTMNAVRGWERVRMEAAPQVSRFITFNSYNFTTRSGGQTQTLSNSSRSTITINGQGGVTVTTTPNAVIPPAPGPVWANVSADTWISFGWWAGLGVMSLITLAVVLILRRRFGGDRPPWRLVGAAGMLFALYAGYHALVFSREFIL